MSPLTAPTTLTHRDMPKTSFKKYLLYDLKHCARYPPTMRYHADKQVRKNAWEYCIELGALKGAHPGVSSSEIDNGTHTHTLMTGGKFLFNEEEIPEHIVFPKEFQDLHLGLRETLQRVLNRRETYADMLWMMLTRASLSKTWDLDACLAEAISRPYHRFFLDLDLLFYKEHATAKEWSTFVRSVCFSVGKAVMLCYPEIRHSLDPVGDFEFSVLSTNGYRAKTLEDNKTVFKRGIHMIWPGLIVDRERAECLARLMDEFLTRDVPRNVQAGENTWRDAIDLSVYRSGLRPIGCPKITPCAKCREVARKRVPSGMDFDMSYRELEFRMCHPPNGFNSQGDASVYALNMIARADGAALVRTNFRARIDKHIVKDTVTGIEYDFSLKHLTSIRTTLADPTPGFMPPFHLRGPFYRDMSDFNIHTKQNPETGDYLKTPARKNTDPQNSNALTLTTAQMNRMTQILQDFHPKYANVVIDRVWAFRNDDSSKMLPPRPGYAPKKSLYSHMWFNVKGEGSHYCHNKDGMHASNTIRFVVDYLGNIAQGCWCMKTYNGKICSRQTTKGMPGFVSKMDPRDNILLTDIFSTPMN